MPRLPAGDDLAVLGYTSGTTGRAKGAMILHRNLAANIAAIREAWCWTDADHLLLTLPLFHTHGLMVGAHGTLTAGATMTLHRRFEAPAVFRALQNDPVTLFFGVPTMYLRLLQEARGPASGAHAAVAAVRFRQRAPQPADVRGLAARVRADDPGAVRHDRDGHEHDKPV